MSDTSHDLFISCDWGTSNFRLRLADRHSGRILADWSTEDGIGKLTRENGLTEPAARERFLLRYLGSQAAQLRNGNEYPPIVVSGMASSSIGIRELPYASLPFSVTGSDIFSQTIEGNDDCRHDVLLCSGVRSERDAMRGEETQLVGLLAQKPELGATPAIFIFPGTHSKHVAVEDQTVTNIRTFLTGELFAAVVKHTVLADSVDATQSAQLVPETEGYFQQGVEASGRGSLLQLLFNARTNTLFGKMTARHNFYYLSGLLIGEELRHLDRNNHLLILCAGHSLQPLYLSAIRTLRLGGVATAVSTEIAEHCIVAGHLAAYRNKK